MGTAAERAHAIGWSVRDFFTVKSRVKNRKNKKYVFVDAEDDDEEAQPLVTTRRCQIKSGPAEAEPLYVTGDAAAWVAPAARAGVEVLAVDPVDAAVWAVDGADMGAWAATATMEAAGDRRARARGTKSKADFVLA